MSIAVSPASRAEICLLIASCRFTISVKDLSEYLNGFCAAFAVFAPVISPFLKLLPPISFAFFGFCEAADLFAFGLNRSFLPAAFTAASLPPLFPDKILSSAFFAAGLLFTALKKSNMLKLPKIISFSQKYDGKIS